MSVVSDNAWNGSQTASAHTNSWRCFSSRAAGEFQRDVKNATRRHQFHYDVQESTEDVLRCLADRWTDPSVPASLHQKIVLNKESGTCVATNVELDRETDVPQEDTTDGGYGSKSSMAEEAPIRENSEVAENAGTDPVSSHESDDSQDGDLDGGRNLTDAEAGDGQKVRNRWWTSTRSLNES